MPKYTDEEGNEIELDAPIDQIKAEREKAVTELNETKVKLASLETKDFNFKKLRDLTDEEKKKLSVREMDLMKRQETLEESQRTWQQQQLESQKKQAMSQYGVLDEETQKKVLAQYDRLSDDASTPEQIASKMRDAVTIALGRSPTSRNPMFAANSMGLPPSTPRSNQVTGELVKLAKNLGISEEDLKKYSS